MSSDSLAQMPESNMADLTQVSEGMQQYIRAATNESRQSAMEAMERQGLLKRLFPSEVERERQRISVDSMRQLAESKREFLAIYTTTQIEIARKRADALIAAQGMHLQAQLARFANEKIQELNLTLNESRTRFMAEMDPQFDTVERYKHRPQLYDPAMESIIHQIDTYFESAKTLLDGFNNSLNNRVSEIQR